MTRFAPYNQSFAPTSADIKKNPLFDQVLSVALGRLLIRESARSEERRVGKECRSWWWRYLSSRRRHTICLSDWSSDVCSSDLTSADIKKNPLFDQVLSVALGRLLIRESA